MDNSSGFRSQLMTKLREKLGIESKFSAPYHYASHGGVERANQTVERMLRKFLSDYPKSWDTIIHYLMFALREVPHSGTRFSAHELVFSRKLRGLLEIARESYTSEDGAQEHLNVPTVKYLENLQFYVHAALNAAHHNTGEAQEQKKSHFDKRSCVRELEPGELVFVLQPTCANKLMANWKGPYKVLRRLHNNNYEIQIGRRTAILHVSSMRKFHTSEAEDTDVTDVNMIITDDAEIDGESLAPVTYETEECEKTFTIGGQLTSPQREQLQQMLQQYNEVLSDMPGRTDLLQHEIRVIDDTPSWQPSYKIPEALRDDVENELIKML